MSGHAILLLPQPQIAEASVNSRIRQDSGIQKFLVFDEESSLAWIVSEVLGHNPTLKAAQALYQAAKRRVLPDPEIRLERREFQSGDRSSSDYDIGVFLELPALRRSQYQALLEEAKKRVETAEHEQTAAQSETTGLVRNQLKKIRTLQVHYLRFRDTIVPLSRQAVQATEAAYVTGRGGFLNLLVALRSAYEAEASLHGHLADYLSALAELEAIAGIDPLLTPKPSQRSPEAD